MIELFEALVEDDQGEDENSKKFIVVEKDKATHVHKCRHDEGKSCNREKLK